jgi:glycosyltransferase involved in cell wall biosynthesis
MKIVFIHQNFPGQFRHIALDLAGVAENSVISICQDHAPKLKSIKNFSYKPARTITNGVHPYLATTEAYVLNGQSVARILLELKNCGFQPDVIFAHTGWGEALYVKDIFPDVTLIGFFEFFYHASGADVGFDPEYPLVLDDALRVRTRNAIHLLSLDAVDFGITPTNWQKSVFPKEYWKKLSVIHEGVGIAFDFPSKEPRIRLPNGQFLTKNDQVVTYVARNLEPYRGFHIFMRAVAEICKRRPNVQIVIVGGDDVSYGKRLPSGDCYRKRALAEVDINTERVHFLGRIPYKEYLEVLSVSSVHVYLTVPFVLSWSMLEAMGAGCLVVGSDTPPVSEVIRDGENGILVNFFSPSSIADAVDQVLESPKDHEMLRFAGRKTVTEKYTIDAGILGYRNLLELALFHANDTPYPENWACSNS